jgi:Fic family protein
MKIPINPPKKIIDWIIHVPLTHVGKIKAVNSKGDYLHWDKLRHLTPPTGLTSEQWWHLTKLAREGLYKVLPFEDKHGKHFVIATPDLVLSKLNSIDRSTGNAIRNPSSFMNTQMKDTYLIQSLIEESITSSQLEGASTTQQVAKEMLHTKRKPRDQSEKMIFNNYEAMHFVLEIKNELLTPKIMLELHRILTKDTLENPKNAGHLRKSDDIHVWDNTNVILHTPPKSIELKERMKKLCDFANTTLEDNNYFIHPIIKAIILHFMLAYDHPFVDGNGRTARALFYWSMANQGYDMMEYISISEIIKRAPAKYAYAYLYTETDENDLTYFVIHQIEVILKAIKALNNYITSQKAEILETEIMLHTNSALKNKLNYRQISLIKHALKHQNMQYKIESHRNSHNVTYDTARNDLLNLEKLGIMSMQKMGKAYIFIPRLDLKKFIKKIT